ncbi:TIM barrel protein [Microbacterium sp. ARD31]|uniref:sugar phosphate isomerase/epimerase family protein n=1 Tax=Microbacterium sp. ARD31 TaxID=2962576 RepID=UPI00288270D9|nr:TIM barrel protein [Microbacterium sp. ARD31]MDT0183990.1 TIM barrel protein [Microbacterium sp. ARD31]
MRALALPQQIDVTAAAGFRRLSVTPADIGAWTASGGALRELLARAADANVALSHLDPLATWPRSWRPAATDPTTANIEYFDTPPRAFLDLAVEIGASSITAMTIAPQGSIGIEELTEDFAALCDDAAELGIVVELEFIPLDWAIPDLASAWEIVSGADRSNSGIVFDFWHFMHSGSSLEMLRTVPGDRITSVQLADASLSLQTGSWFDDCLEMRLPLGMGEFPVQEILDTLAVIDGLHKVGPEYFSSANDSLEAEALRDILANSTRELFGA